jgi:hypothetical protein
MKQRAGSWKKNKINKPPAKLIKRRREICISKIKDEKGNIIRGINEIQMIMCEYFKTCSPENWKIKKK